jgi:large subunit ribosomal protein L22
VDVSPKTAREVCKSIRGMFVNDAKEYLQSVKEKKVPVSFRRFKKGSGHRSEINGFHAGAYPVKAATKVMEVLSNLEANAEFKGRDLDRMKIIHASAARGRIIRAYTPRAQGRSSPSFNTLVHIELIATEA